MSIQVYAGDTGVNLGQWTSPVIPEGGVVTVDVGEILAEVSSTNLETDTFNLAAGSGFAGRLQYTVGGPGDTTVDLTTKCRLGPWQSQRQAQREATNDLASTSSINPAGDAEVRQRERPSFNTYPGNPKHGDPELGTGAEITWSFYDPEVSTSRPCIYGYREAPCLAEDIPDRLKGYIRRAYDIWSQAADVTFVELPPDTPVVNYRVGMGRWGLRGAYRIVDTPSNSTAHNNNIVSFNGDTYGEIKAFDKDFLDEMLAIIGHNLGLRGEQVVRSIFGVSNRVNYLFELGGVTEDDIAGVRFLYGPPKRISKTYVDDFDGHARTGALIAPGETIAGNIDFADDEDWFEVNLTPGQSYLIELTPGEDGTPLTSLSVQLHYTHFFLYRLTPDPFLANVDTDKAHIAFTPHYSGAYWITVRGDQGAMGSYQLSVTDLSAMDEVEDEEPEPAVSEGEEDLPHNLESEGFVPIDGSATGTLDSAADRDFFRVKLVSGAQYEFTVTGPVTEQIQTP